MANTLDAEIIIKAADKASKVFDQIGKNAEGVGARLNRVGTNMMRAGAVMTAAVTVPVLAGIATAAKKAAEFQEMTTELRKELSSQTTAEFEKTVQDLRNVSRASAFSHADIFNVATQGAEFGIAANEIAQYAKVVDDTAMAFNANVQQMGVDLATVAKGFKLDADGIEDAADAVQFMSDNFNSSETDLLGFVKTVAPSAHVLNLSAEQAAAFGGALLGAGMNASEAASGMEMFFKRIASPKGMEHAAKVAGKTAKQFEKMFSEDSNAAILDVVKSIAKLGSESKQLAALQAIAGDRAALVMMPMVKAYQDVEAAQQAVRDGLAVGMISDRAIESAKTFKNQWGSLMSTLDDIKITAGNVVLPTILSNLKALSTFLDEATKDEAGRKRIEWATKLGLGAAAVGPLLIASGAVVRAMGSLSKAYSSLALMTGSSKLGLAFKAGVAGFALYSLAQNFDAVAQHADMAQENISFAMTFASESIRSLWEGDTETSVTMAKNGLAELGTIATRTGTAFMTADLEGKLGMIAGAATGLWVAGKLAKTGILAIKTGAELAALAVALLGTSMGGAAIAATALAAGVGYLAYKRWDEISGDITRAGEAARSTASAFGDLLKATSDMDTAGQMKAAKSFWSGISDYMDNIAAIESELVSEFFKSVGAPDMADKFNADADRMRNLINASKSEVKPPPFTNAPVKRVEIPFPDAVQQRIPIHTIGPAIAASIIQWFQKAPAPYQMFFPQMSPSSRPRLPALGPTLDRAAIELPPFRPGALNEALAGKVEATVTQPVKAQLEGQASLTVNLRVDGPARVTSTQAVPSKHIAPRVGVDNTGTPARGTERF